MTATLALRAGRRLPDAPARLPDEAPAHPHLREEAPAAALPRRAVQAAPTTARPVLLRRAPKARAETAPPPNDAAWEQFVASGMGKKPNPEDPPPTPARPTRQRWKALHPGVAATPSPAPKPKAAPATRGATTEDELLAMLRGLARRDPEARRLLADVRREVDAIEALERKRRLS